MERLLNSWGNEYVCMKVYILKTYVIGAVGFNLLNYEDICVRGGGVVYIGVSINIFINGEIRVTVVETSGFNLVGGTE